MSPDDNVFEVIDGMSLPDAAPMMNWRECGPREHFVQFYEEDEYLVESVAGFIGAGLGAGEGAIVVATAAHRGAILQKLEANGLDVRLLQERGEFFVWDADETLAKFMVDGMPDETLFNKRIGSIISTASVGRTGVRAFGEMVAVLWAEGNGVAAIELESLWNRLAEQHSFSLFCAYPMAGFRGEANGESLLHVCNRHTRVIPSESYDQKSSADQRLRSIAVLQQKAISLEAEIGERKEIERRLRIQQAKMHEQQEELLRALDTAETLRNAAETASLAKDRFLASLSHELRTPLTPVLMSLELWAEDPALSEPMRNGMEMMRKNIALEARLIDDLLDLTAITRGKVKLHREMVDLHALLEHAVQTGCEDQAFKKNLTIDTRFAAEQFGVSADWARLEQVFLNLCRNAVKFTPDGGVIRIETMNPAPGQVSIRITDSGVGIPAEAIDRIFNPFEQATAETTARFGGLGLGLAICKSVVELHNGTISAESAGTGTGATFTVTLKASPLLKKQIDVTDDVPSPKGLRVLLVEDHGHTAQVLAKLLARRHEVTVVATLADARRATANHEFDFLISDMGLPDGSGLELMRELRSRRGLTGIALSGYGMEKDVQASLDAGFKEHLLKPVDWKKLEEVIRRMCATR